MISDKLFTCNRCVYKSDSAIDIARHVRLGHPVTDDEKQKIVGLFKTGLNQHKISLEMFRADSTIKAILIAANLIETSKNGNEPDSNSESTQPSGPVEPAEYVLAFENRVVEFRKLLAEKNLIIQGKETEISRLKQEVAEARRKVTEVTFNSRNFISNYRNMTEPLG